MIDLAGLSTVSAPGGVCFNSGCLAFKTSTVSPVSRVGFNLLQPRIIKCENDLVFDIKFSTPDQARLDILKGDIGFPEISFGSSDAIFYRFKRGNIKDFLSIADLASFQRVEIPLGSLKYHRDMKTNALDSGFFWQKPIACIYFDFLSNAQAAVDIQIRNIYIIDAPQILPSALDLLSISSEKSNADLPLWASEDSRIVLRITLNSAGRFLCSQDADIELTISNHLHRSIHARPLSGDPIYLELPMPHLGEYALYISLRDSNAMIAKTSLTCARMLKSSSRRAIKLGISDGHGFGTINLLQPWAVRRVLPLSSVFFDRSSHSHYFKPNANILATLEASNAKHKIVAFKSMPLWLRKELPHAERLGPRSLDDFRDLIEWLIPQLVRSGVTAIESWNEANVIHEWNDGMDVLLRMHEIVFSVARKISSGLSILTPSSTSWDFAYFLQLEKSGFFRSCDAIALHGYTYDPTSLVDSFERMAQIGKRLGLSIYITEVGFRMPAFASYESSLYLCLLSLLSHFDDIIKACLWFRYQKAEPEEIGFYDQDSSSGYSMIGSGDTYARGTLSSFRFMSVLLPHLQPIEYTRCRLGQCVFYGSSSFGDIMTIYSETSDFSYISDSKGCMLDLYGGIVNPSDLCRHKIIFLIPFEMYSYIS